MNKLLIATSNEAKKIEMKHALLPLVEKGIALLTLDDFSIIGEPVESGGTFEENAKIKAQF